LTLVDECAVCEPTETDERVRRVLQPLIMTAVRELQSLRDELDLAYAAAPEFDVEAVRLLCVLAINLLLRQPHILERLRDCARMRIDARAHTFGEARKELR